jgi:hypothetical protein
MTKILATKIVREMGLANDCKFKPTNAQVEKLSKGLDAMVENGFKPTSKNIDIIVDGEDSEQNKFNKFKGYKTVNAVLSKIFDS